MSGEILVTAIDDHPVILRGVKAYLEHHAADIELICVAPTVAAIPPEMIEKTSVALLDVNLADDSSLAANVTQLRAQNTRVLMYTSEQRPAVISPGLRAGALGLILKEDPEEHLVTGIRAAHEGEHYASGRLALQIISDPSGDVQLSERELAVMTYIARGLTHHQIAKMLHITVETVRTYRKRAIETYVAAVSDNPDNGEVTWQMLRDGHIRLRG